MWRSTVTGAYFSVYVSTLPCATTPIFQTRLIVSTPVLPLQSFKLKEYCLTVQAPKPLLRYCPTVSSHMALSSLPVSICTRRRMRAMVIMTISEVFGGLVGSWIMRSPRTGRRVILVDVPIAQLDQLPYQVELRAHA